jgi:hypothetical protein
MQRCFVAVVVTAGVLAAAPSALGAVFVVNSTAGTSDAGINGDCDTDPSADDDCTLVAAIQEANATAGADAIGFYKTPLASGTADPDDVSFVGGMPAATVSVNGVIPAITHPLTVNGGDCAANFADRAPCAVVGGGWVVNSDGEVLIEGLAFNGTGTAVDVAHVGGTIAGTPDFILRANWFGVDTEGVPGTAPVTDVLLRDVTGALIGGDPTVGPNIFARHGSVAVDIFGADNTEISNNQFGVLPDGSFARAGEGASANGDNIEVNGDSTPNPDNQATGTVIGLSNAGLVATPTCDGGCNLIDGAGVAEGFDQPGAAIDLQGDGSPELPADHVTIVGNHIGQTNGITAAPQNTDGIVVGSATNVQIGGPTAGNADRNLIVGGISSGGGASGLLIQDNVASGVTGSFATNTFNLQGSGQVLDNFVFTPQTAKAAIALDNTSSPNFTVQGNVIGEDVNGNALDNGDWGILVRDGADNNLIGGSGAGDGNLISDLAPTPAQIDTTGISIAGDNNVVRGNTIGVGTNGSAHALIDGVELRTELGTPTVEADGNTIGGSTPLSENLISNVRDDAIVITDPDSDNNLIDRNRGAANGQQFIDLGDDGLGNLPDPGGPNTGAQAPAITVASGTAASGTAAAGATVRLFTKATSSSGELEGLVAAATANGSGAWTAAYTAQPDGKLLAATATVSSNTSELSSAFAVDAAAPQTQIDSGPATGSSSPDSTPTFGFSSSEAGSTFQCRLDGGSFGACGGPGGTHTTAILADGSHTFEVRATDLAANTDATPASRTFIVDTTAPDTQIDSGPAPNTTIADSTPTFGFSANEAGASFECRVGSDAFAACGGPGATHTTPALTDGQHTIEVRATDAAGNADGSPATRTFTVDATAPDTQIDSGPAAGSTVADPTPSFGFSATEAGSTFECRVDGEAFAACTSEHTTASLDDGQHTFEVRATDAVGNADGSPATRPFNVDAVPNVVPDTKAPETTIDKAPKKKSTKRKAKFAFSSNEAGSTFECMLDKGDFEPCGASAKFKVKVGKHKLFVRATDQAGNADRTPATAKWKVKKP